MIGRKLKTERLVLRPLDPDDAPALLEYAESNRSWLSPWEPSRLSSYYTVQVQRSILHQCLEDRRSGTGVLFGIFEKGDKHTVLGRISVSSIVRGIWQNGFVGYSIDHTRAGKGYMTEALRRVILYSFADLALHRIQASIVPRNIPSLRVAAKCGLRSEGIALRYMEIDNIWEDHEIFALTIEELSGGEIPWVETVT